MDPNAALTRIRQLMTEWRQTEENGDANQVLDELAEAVAALDEWVAKGGFLPDNLTTPPPALILDTSGEGPPTLVCPECGASDHSIQEVDSAIRYNRLSEVAVDEDGTIAGLFWGTADSNFEHEHYQCGECQLTVSLPDSAVDPSEEWN